MKNVSPIVVFPLLANPAHRSDTIAPWTFPNTEKEKLQYLVFKDLWENGYYLTDGSKFGGDFLVYPGKVLLKNSYLM